MTRHAVICLTLFTLVTMGSALPRAERDHVEYKVKKLMECTKIKAVGLAIVGKGDVTSMAFSSEEVDEQRNRIQGEVTNNTKFCLGGATEAFTAVMLAKLLARNENITWSTPIEEMTGQRVHLSESYRSAHLTMKDIFAQRSGYPDMDIVTVAKPFKDAEELTIHLRFLQPVAGFREKFVPNKILFSLLHQAIRDLTNASWENMMREFIFRPLQMDSVVFLGEKGVPDNEDIAKPMVYHGKHAHYISLGSFRGLQLIKEASSVCMSPVDMGKWLKFLTTGRDAKGRKLIDMDTLKETFEGVQSRGHSDNPAISGFKRTNMFKVAYNRDQNALGWITGNYRGYRFVSQDGSMAGADTLATYVPDRKVGVFVSITGAGEGKALAAKTLINTYVLDHLMRGSQVSEPWLESMDSCSVLGHIQSDVTRSTKHNNVRRTNSPAGGRSLYDYQGHYRNYAYGDVHILYNETLTMEYGHAEYRLDGTNQNDTFELSAKQDLWFTTGAGKPRSKRIIAVFIEDPHEEDDRIRDVVISGLDKNRDILFSHHPVPPRYESIHEDCRCEDGASPMASSVSLLVLILLVSMVNFFR